MIPDADRRPLNWPILLISLAVSVMLWLNVDAANAPTGVTTIDVRPQGLDTSRFFLREMQARVTVTVRGTPEQVDNLMRNAAAYVDFSNARPGRRSYPLKITPESLILEDAPSTIPAEVEALIEKRLPVSVDTKGKLREEGYVLDALRPEPETAIVRGPSSEVQKINRIQAIVDLDRVDAIRPREVLVRLEALTREGGQAMENVRTEPLEINVAPAVSVAPEEKVFFVRPTVVGAPAPGYTATYAVEPRQVVATGRSIDLAQLSQVTTKPVDLSGLTETRTFEVQLRVPDRIRLKPNSVKVTVRVEQQPRVYPPAASDPPDTTPETNR